MAEYQKIQTLFKRDERNIIIPDQFIYPEFEVLKDLKWECIDANEREKFLTTLLSASLILLKNILNALICLITSFRIITNKYSMINN